MPQLNPPPLPSSLQQAVPIPTPKTVPAVAPPPTQQTLPSQSLPSGVTEDAIQRLCSLGAPREQAISLLLQCGGNVDMAASYLFF